MYSISSNMVNSAKLSSTDSLSLLNLFLEAPKWRWEKPPELIEPIALPKSAAGPASSLTSFLYAVVSESQNHRITESQNGRGWKGPLWVTQSNPPAEAGSPTAGCTGPSALETTQKMLTKQHSYGWQNQDGYKPLRMPFTGSPVSPTLLLWHARDKVLSLRGRGEAEGGGVGQDRCEMSKQTAF